MGDNVSIASTAADSNAKHNMATSPKAHSFEGHGNSERQERTDSIPLDQPTSDVEKGTGPPNGVEGDDPYIVRLTPTDAEHPYVRPPHPFHSTRSIDGSLGR